MENLWKLSASELAGAIARGEVAALAAVEAHIARIAEVDAKLHAMVWTRYDEARAEARELDRRRAAGEALGPLGGVPLTIKESLDLAGSPSTYGLSSRAKVLAERDDRHVARLKRAGAIILGKTNVAQLLFFVETDNPLYGRTDNPYDAERSPGGSSGGQAAIIATGGSALGLGSDIAGSLRIPAAFCGIASLKPTAGRTPDEGRLSAPLGQRAIVSQVGVLARSVADVALGLEVINGGRNPGDDGRLEPGMPLGDPATVDVAGLRVAYYSDDGTFAVSPAVARAVKKAVEILRARGATVTAWTPPEVGHALDLAFGLLSADGGVGLVRNLGRDPRDPRIAKMLQAATASRSMLSLLRPLLRLSGRNKLAAITRNYGRRDADHYFGLVEAQRAYQARFAAALDGLDGGPADLVLCPAFALPAVRHGATEELLLGGAYTILWNLLGYPAGVVPVTRVQSGEESARPASREKMEQVAAETERGSAGLPIAVQVVARPWREHVALAAMAAIEKAVGWEGFRG